MLLRYFIEIKLKKNDQKKIKHMYTTTTAYTIISPEPNFPWKWNIIKTTPILYHKYLKNNKNKIPEQN